MLVDPEMETVLFIHLRSTQQPHIHVHWSYMAISRLGKTLLFLLCPKAISGNQGTSRRKTTEHTRCLLGTHGRDRRGQEDEEHYGEILREQRTRACGGYPLHDFGLYSPELQVPARFTQLPFPGHSQDLGRVSRAWTWYCMWDTVMYRIT